jgi:hypothetical protein
MISRDAALDHERCAVDRALPADRLQAGPALRDLRRGRGEEPEARLGERPLLPRARGLLAGAGLGEQAEPERAGRSDCLYFFSLLSFSLLCGFSFFFAHVW